MMHSCPLDTYNPCFKKSWCLVIHLHRGQSGASIKSKWSWIYSSVNKNILQSENNTTVQSWLQWIYNYWKYSSWCLHWKHWSPKAPGLNETLKNRHLCSLPRLLQTSSAQPHIAVVLLNTAEHRTAVTGCGAVDWCFINDVAGSLIGGFECD